METEKENIVVFRAAKKEERRKKLRNIEKSLPLHLMMLAPVYLLLLFHIGGLFGLVMAFQDYLPGQGWYVFGSKFVGFENFRRIFENPEIWRIIRNTVVIALSKMIVGTIAPVVLAVLLNEVEHSGVKRGVQTFVVIPHFISWVILSGIFVRLFSPDGGVLTTMFAKINIDLPDFLGDPDWFPFFIVVSALWQGTGYAAIVYLAAITTIDPNLYEAAEIDGAGYMRKCFHITVPGLLPTIILMSILNMGNILNAGFDQIYQLYTDMVYSTGDVLDTYIYRVAFEGAMDYGLSVATGLLKSLVSLCFVVSSYVIAYKKFDYKVF